MANPGATMSQLRALLAVALCTRCTTLRMSAARAPLRMNAQPEHVEFWTKYEGSWQKPLRLLDVKTALSAGECDGVLPSGRPSRGAPDEQLLSLGTAYALFEDEKLLVRRRFRSMTAAELLPRWEAVAAKREALRRQGGEIWDQAVREVDTATAAQRALLEGDYDKARAATGGGDSDRFEAAAVKAFSPVMRGLATTMNRADGGAAMARLDLLEAAATSSDRWLISALLEELEREARRIGDERRASSSEDRGNRPFQSAEELVENAQREGADAGVLGVLAAVFVVAAQQFLSGNMAGSGSLDGLGGVASPAGDGLNRALDLLQ